MDGDSRPFYDELAEHYHLLFEDWNSSIAHQGTVLDSLIRTHLSKLSGNELPTVLDATCGIGTQAIGLAGRGYHVRATDLSAAAVARAEREARARGLALETSVADVRTLDVDITGVFDVVLACDNALPHLLTDDDLLAAVSAINAKLRPGGVLIASLRDYDTLVGERPRFTSQRVFDDSAGRRIVFQIWDWSEDASRYRLHQFIVREGAAGWSTLQFEADYRALRRDEALDALRRVGFVDVRWLDPEESGYFQPLIVGHRAL